MQHLENDMDGLFQRAGENYELDDSKSGWENILGRIKDEEAKPFQKKGNKSRSSYLMIFSLFAGLFLFYPKVLLDCAQSLKKLNEVKVTTANRATGIETTNNQTSLLIPRNNSRPFFVNKSFKRSVPPRYTLSTISGNTISPKNDVVRNEENKIDHKEEIPENNNNYSSTFSVPAVESNGIVNTPEEATNTKITPEESVNPNSNSKVSPGKEKLKIISSDNKKGIYIGIAGASDFSKVGSMAFRDVSLGAGIILGYTATNKFSVETGVSLSKKKYNSYGKDFSMDKVGSNMPSAMIINDLQSETNIIEIPLKLRYTVIAKNRSSFSITGGLSTYIVTKEKNHYNMSLNGRDEKMLGDYEKNNFKIPAIANFSLGYQHNVSRLLDIRIEPLLKIPLQGIGVGSLKVMSAGLQIGIISRLK